jgi:hypothetical protein
MIVDVKDASFRVFHEGRFCSWSISAYQHQPVYAITSRTKVAVSAPLRVLLCTLESAGHHV